MAIETETPPSRRIAVHIEKYEALRQLVDQLEREAGAREKRMDRLEAELRKRDATIQQQQNTIRDLHVRVLSSEERLMLANAENALLKDNPQASGQVLAQLADTKRNLRHALAIISQLLKDQGKDWGATSLDPDILRAIVAECAPVDAFPQSPSTLPASHGNRTTASGSSRSTARPQPLRSRADSPDVENSGDNNGRHTPTTQVPQDVKIMSPSSDMYISDVETDTSQAPDDATGSAAAQGSHRRTTSGDRERLELVSPSASSSRMAAPGADPSMPVAVYWKEAPQVAYWLSGPWNWERIQDSLRLEDVVAESVQSLVNAPQSLGIPVDIHDLGSGIGNVAFLYRPMFYETGGKTYLVCWSDKDTHIRNRMILARWCKATPSGSNNTHIRPTLHVIAYPDVDDLAAKGWWYYCAMTWKVVRMDPVWDILDPEQKGNLLEHLSHKTQDMTREEVALALDTGKLLQLTIQLRPEPEEKTAEFQSRVLKMSPEPSPEPTISGSVSSRA